MKQVNIVHSPTSSTMPNGSTLGGGGLVSPGARHRMSVPSKEKNKLHITTSLTFQESSPDEEEMEQGEGPAELEPSGTLRKQKVCSTLLVM